MQTIACHQASHMMKCVTL